MSERESTSNQIHHFFPSRSDARPLINNDMCVWLCVCVCVLAQCIKAAHFTVVPPSQHSSAMHICYLRACFDAIFFAFSAFFSIFLFFLSILSIGIGPIWRMWCISSYFFLYFLLSAFTRVASASAGSKRTKADTRTRPMADEREQKPANKLHSYHQHGPAITSCCDSHTAEPSRHQLRSLLLPLLRLVSVLGNFAVAKWPQNEIK